MDYSASQSLKGLSSMLSSARFLAALLVAILVLPHTHSFAKSRTLLPTLPSMHQDP